MKVLFDSSTLIASMVESHPKHDQALPWLRRAHKKEFDLVVSAHSLLEIYSVLTKAPFKPKISAASAYRLIASNIKTIATIEFLNSDDYFDLLKLVSSTDIKGGIVYDALIYLCAKKSNSKKLVTANAKDFNKFNGDNAVEIISI